MLEAVLSCWCQRSHARAGPALQAGSSTASRWNDEIDREGVATGCQLDANWLERPELVIVDGTGAVLVDRLEGVGHVAAARAASGVSARARGERGRGARQPHVFVKPSRALSKRARSPSRYSSSDSGMAAWATAARLSAEPCATRSAAARAAECWACTAAWRRADHVTAGTTQRLHITPRRSARDDHRGSQGDSQAWPSSAAWEAAGHQGQHIGLLPSSRLVGSKSLQVSRWSAVAR